MSQAPQFVISEFTNPSGEIVFRLTGRLHGLRIRKNFKTRVAAGAGKDALDIKAAQSANGIRSTATGLTDEHPRHRPGRVCARKRAADLR